MGTAPSLPIAVVPQALSISDNGQVYKDYTSSLRSLFESSLVGIPCVPVSGKEISCSSKAGALHVCKSLGLGSNSLREAGSRHMAQQGQQTTNQLVGAQGYQTGPYSFPGSAGQMPHSDLHGQHCSQGPHQPPGWVHVIEITQGSMNIYQLGGASSGFYSGRAHKGVSNTQADWLSRETIDLGEWALKPEVLQLIVNRFGLPLVDLFATHPNREVPRFLSRNYHWEAEAMDPLSVEWPQGLLYAFPPVLILQNVLWKICGKQIEVIVVAPW